jgi:beta-lactamase class A
LYAPWRGRVLAYRFLKRVGFDADPLYEITVLREIEDLSAIRQVACPLIERLSLAIFLLHASTGIASAAGPDLSKLEATFDQIVRASRAEVGIALIHLDTGAHFEIHGDQRFPLASVCKLPIAVELLRQTAEEKVTLEQQVWLGASDIRPCCTLSRRHPKGGVTPSVRELLELMIIESDNTASDAVLKLVGGPRAVERSLRALGFSSISINRYEGELLLEMAGVTSAPPAEEWTLELQRRLVDEVHPEALREGRIRYLTDARDMATPYDMALFLGRLQLGNLLPPSQTDLLLHLMAQSTTGPRRLKGRLPAETLVAHKTGTTTIVINDVGIITLPPESAISGRVVLTVFVKSGSSVRAMERTIAQWPARPLNFSLERRCNLCGRGRCARRLALADDCPPPKKQD